MLLGLHNHSPLSADLCSDWSHDRAPVAVVSLKGSFRLGESGTCTLINASALELVDRHVGDPLASPLAAARENVPFKQGAEWYVVNAIGRGPHADATAGEASVSVRTERGECSKGIRYFGRRTWSGSRLIPAIGEPEPLTEVTLDYGNAYGGRDPNAGPREAPVYEPNPAGTGYWCSARHALGQELPRIECEPFITRPESRPAPAGFGPVAPHWLPRSTERGTPNESAAVEGGSPRPPDASASFFNAAPMDQRLPHPFLGGEELILTNLLPGLPYGQPCRVVLPRFAPQVALHVGEIRKRLLPVCDTLVIDGEARQIHLIARVAFPWRHTDPRHGWGVARDTDAPAVRRPSLERVK